MAPRSAEFRKQASRDHVERLIYRDLIEPGGGVGQIGAVERGDGPADRIDVHDSGLRRRRPDRVDARQYGPCELDLQLEPARAAIRREKSGMRRGPRVIGWLVERGDTDRPLAPRGDPTGRPVAELGELLHELVREEIDMLGHAEMAEVVEYVDPVACGGGDDRIQRAPIETCRTRLHRRPRRAVADAVDAEFGEHSIVLVQPRRMQRRRPAVDDRPVHVPAMRAVEPRHHERAEHSDASAIQVRSGRRKRRKVAVAVRPASDRLPSRATLVRAATVPC